MSGGPPRPLRAASERFLDAFDAVFHHDWVYSCEQLCIPTHEEVSRRENTVLRMFGEVADARIDRGTFLHPTPADTNELDWGNYAELLEAYSELRASLAASSGSVDPASRGPRASRRVTLYDLEGVAAIILESSGVVYSNQTCGHVCLQPEAEGILVPFNDDPPLDRPELALAVRLQSLLLNVPRLTAALADAVDAELAAHPATNSATVDRKRLAESHEAWLFVDLNPRPDALYVGFGACKAVLTWPNSD